MTPPVIHEQALQRQIDELAAISETPAPSVTRVLFSEADLRSRQFVRKLCRALGLGVREDAVGNLFARWAGTAPDAAAIATGSHTDAIPNAGRYDGVVGVLGALEALRALQAAGFAPRRSIELIVFTAEEPTRFGIGCLGSRLLGNALAPDRAAAMKDRDRMRCWQERKLRWRSSRRRRRPAVPTPSERPACSVPRVAGD